MRVAQVVDHSTAAKTGVRIPLMPGFITSTPQKCDFLLRWKRLRFLDSDLKIYTGI